jgi:hypothetical protein
MTGSDRSLLRSFSKWSFGCRAWSYEMLLTRGANFLVVTGITYGATKCLQPWSFRAKAASLTIITTLMA